MRYSLMPIGFLLLNLLLVAAFPIIALPEVLCKADDFCCHNAKPIKESDLNSLPANVTFGEIHKRFGPPLCGEFAFVAFYPGDGRTEDGYHSGGFHFLFDPGAQTFDEKNWRNFKLRAIALVNFKDDNQNIIWPAALKGKPMSSLWGDENKEETSCIETAPGKYSCR